MGFREVKAELNNMSSSEIIKLISEMYKKIPQVKDFLDVFATGDIQDIIAKHKLEIEKYVFPHGRDMVMRESEARKLIRNVRKLKIKEIDIELELHYVSCCLEIIQDFGYWDENYYVALEKMFENAVKGISLLGLQDQYEHQISKLAVIAVNYGIELEF